MFSARDLAAIRKDVEAAFLTDEVTLIKQTATQAPGGQLKTTSTETTWPASVAAMSASKYQIEAGYRNTAHYEITLPARSEPTMNDSITYAGRTLRIAEVLDAETDHVTHTVMAVEVQTR